MATLSISWTVPDSQITSIKDDFATYYGFVQGGGETQNAFIKRIIGEYIKSSVKSQRMQAALKQTQATVTADADVSVILS